MNNSYKQYLILLFSLFLLTGCSEEARQAIGVAFGLILAIIFIFIASIISVALIGLRIAPKRTLFSFGMAILTAIIFQASKQAPFYAIASFIISWIIGRFIFKKDQWKMFRTKGYGIFVKILSALALLLSLLSLIMFTGAILTYLSADSKIIGILLFPIMLGVIGLYGLVRG
ncbi:hypothetical protein D6774_03615 [Candidatus Woesearchaeota archaeon]|jgi:hypothetical protein|nr:MAG: hypothetical protein D6774_03615 [Candidatus Woesearchaeota archaeon]